MRRNRFVDSLGRVLPWVSWNDESQYGDDMFLGVHYWVGAKSREGPFENEWTDWSMLIHKWVAARDPYFHTHQAEWGVRIILSGTYEEQIWPSLRTRVWTTGDVGIVRHHHSHRVSRIIDGPVYTLWFRGPSKYDTRMNTIKPDGIIDEYWIKKDEVK